MVFWSDMYPETSKFNLFSTPKRSHMYIPGRTFGKSGKEAHIRRDSVYFEKDEEERT